MRRFETLLRKPVAVWEVDVRGADVITREDGTEHRRTFGSTTEAGAHVDAEVERRRAAGYVEIKRVAAPVREESVHRDEGFRWKDGRHEYFVDIAQDDCKLKYVEGEVIDEYGREAAPQVTTARTIREASATYDGWVKTTKGKIERAQRRVDPVVVMREDGARLRAVVEARPRNVHGELEAQCRASPKSVEPWEVYADWLIARGDPVGEIAALGLALETGRAHELLTGYEELEETDAVEIDFELRWGFVQHLFVKPTSNNVVPLAEIVKTLLMSPVSRFVDSLQFGLANRTPEENDWSATMRVIAESEQAVHIRELRFDAFESEDCEMSWVHYGDFSDALAKLPALEVLHIRAGGDGALGAFDLPRLTTFVRESGSLRRADVEAVCARPRPKLAHLALWTGSTNYGGEVTLDDLRPIFDARGFPALGHLGIVNSELSDELIPALATSRVLPQLYSLDLSMGIFAATATAALCAHAEKFRHLASIDLSENMLVPAEIEQIKAVLDNCIFNMQREREDDFPGDPGERYVVLSE